MNLTMLVCAVIIASSLEYKFEAEDAFMIIGVAIYSISVDIINLIKTKS
jgi:hypothetical protein